MAPDSRKNEFLQIRLPGDLKAEFQATLAREGKQTSTVIRHYIESYLLLRKELSDEQLEKVRHLL